MIQNLSYEQAHRSGFRFRRVCFSLILLACERGERNPTTMRVGHDDASHSWRRRRDFALNAALLWWIRIVQAVQEEVQTRTSWCHSNAQRIFLIQEFLLNKSIDYQSRRLEFAKSLEMVYATPITLDLSLGSSLAYSMMRFFPSSFTDATFNPSAFNFNLSTGTPIRRVSIFRIWHRMSFANELRAN